MTCKVMLVGEGPNDIGDLAREPTYGEGREGFLQPVLRTMAGPDIELEFVGRKLLKLPKAPTGRASAGKLNADAASRALAFASAQQARVLVLAFDLDKSPGRSAGTVERRRRLADLRRSAETGFAHTRAQDPEAAEISAVVAIPCRMIEAWALGDRDALAGLLDRDVEDLDYASPEELWGDEHDPDSSHPKRVWQRVTDDHVTFARIGDAADPAVLRETCRDSFAPFADDVDGAIAQCGRSQQRGDKRPARRRSR